MIQFKWFVIGYTTAMVNCFILVWLVERDLARGRKRSYGRLSDK